MGYNMVKAALIILDSTTKNQKNSIFSKIAEKLIDYFYTFIPNKIERITLDEGLMTINVIRIPIAGDLKQDNLNQRLGKILNWLEKERVSVVSFDNYIADNCYEFVKRVQQLGISISYGYNLFYPIAIKTIKKLLKSKGLDLNNIDMAIVADEDSSYEVELIKYLSPQIKYLTFVCDKNIKVQGLIDDIFNNFGFSIRVCSSIKECINELDLIFNISNKTLSQKDLRTKKKIVIFNVFTPIDIHKENISVLNDIEIDISTKIQLPSQINNKYKYNICEIYILAKLDKLYLLKHQSIENDFENIYNYFKNNFKICSLNGINL